MKNKKLSVLVFVLVALLAFGLAACGADPKTYTVTVTAATNGTVEVSENNPEEGSDVTITATPATGYTLDEFNVGGTAVTPTAAGSAYTYVIAAISADVTVTVTFKEIPPEEVTISLNKTTLTLEKYTSETLIPDVKNTTDAVVWTSSAPAVATVDSVTGKVFGLTAGNTTITASVGGKDATCVVTVEASGDEAFNIPASAITLDNGGMYTIIPTFTYNNVNRLSEATVTYVSATPADVEVSSTGIVTALGEETTVRITVSIDFYGYTDSKTLDVTIRGVKDLTSEGSKSTFTVYKYNASQVDVAGAMEIDLGQNVEGTNAVLRSNGVTLDSTVSGRVITINASEKANIIGYGEQTFTLTTSMYTYTFKATIVTEEITTKERLVAMTGDRTATSTYSGYYVLGANIAFGQYEWVGAQVSGTSPGHNGGSGNGFNGVFDGQGYTISGGVYADGGLFVNVQAGSIIKNVAFINVGVHRRSGSWGRASVIAWGFAGTLENVYIDARSFNASGTGLTGPGTSGDGGAAVADNITADARITNCVMIFSGWVNGNANNGFITAVSGDFADNTASAATTIVSNCWFLVGDMTDGGGNPTLQIANGKAAVNTALAASVKTIASIGTTPVDMTGFTSDVWETGWLYPIFKTDNSRVLEILNTDDIIVEGNTLQMTASSFALDIVWSIKEGTVTGVSINESTGLLTVTEAASAGKITIVATSAVFGTDEIELEVLKLTKVDLTNEGNKADLTLFKYNDQGEDIASAAYIDLGTSIAGINGVLRNGTTVISATVSGNVITISATDRSKLGWGEQTFTLTTSTHQYTFTAFIITEEITTKERLVAMTGDRTATSTYSGYYVLGANIAFGQYEWVGAQVSGTSPGHNGGSGNGFNGVFDGQGYTISGGVYGDGGLFVNVQAGSVIKNVAFVNAGVHRRSGSWGRASVIAWGFAGTLENVYISFYGFEGSTTSLTSPHVEGGDGLAAVADNITTAGRITNCVFVASGWFRPTANNGFLTVVSGNLGGNTTNDANTIVSNCWFLLGDFEGNTPQIANGKADVNTALASRLKTIASIDAQLSMTGFTSDAWNTDGLYPVFENDTTITWSMEILNTETEIIEGSELQMSVSSYVTDVVWSIKDGPVTGVSISSSGLLSVTSAAIAGEITVVATSAVYGTEEISLTILKIIGVDLGNLANLTLYKYDDQGTDIASALDIDLGQAVQGTGGVLKNGTTEINYTMAGNIITISAADRSKLGWGEQAFTLTTSTHQYTFTAFIITEEITTKTRLLAMNSAYRAAPSTSYSGYYVLGADITFGATEWVGAVFTPSTSESIGFAGVFDGQGYAIKGGVYNTGGLFGNITANSVVKNVAFIDACVARHASGKGDTIRRSSIIAYKVAGKLENVYISFYLPSNTSTSGIANIGDNSGSAAVSHTITATAEFVNCVFVATRYFQQGDTTFLNAAGGTTSTDATFSNCYFLYDNVTFGEAASKLPPLSNTAGVNTALAARVFVVEDLATALDMTTFTSSVWNTSGLYPVFDNEAFDLTILNTETEVTEGTPLQMTASTHAIDVIWSIKDAPIAGVSISATGELTVDSTVEVLTVTVVATSAAFGADEITLDIITL